MSTLTVAKLDLYRRYAGDLDGWARHARDAERAGIDDADWALIDELLLGLDLVVRGEASASYTQALERRLMEACADADTRAALRALLAMPRSMTRTDGQSPPRHRLWRQDDNGNVFLVASFDRRDDAERELARLASGGHKQLYWITVAHAEPDRPEDSSP